MQPEKTIVLRYGNQLRLPGVRGSAAISTAARDGFFLLLTRCLYYFPVQSRAVSFGEQLNIAYCSAYSNATQRLPTAYTVVKVVL